ncbi:hypothetical protein [Williamsia serinedens]|uniref:Minor tail protein n=1 Tax=Williamsia serinedens TaxID=391736 RepID=A0ABT1H5X5_9NOCA|nr:hypothetical protein [Williamsia serinedens]MCP2162651.1 hypothetical protein [Williamsia serinedens]
MTTPNYPWATTTPADLPQGVSTPSQQGEVLQDHTQAKYTGLAADRFPAIAKTTSAGSPSSVSGPMGFVTSVFSGIVSRVATADPATVTKPDDIVDRAGSFFTGLPLLSFIGDIAGAITGAIGGGLNTIRQFFDDLIGNALQGINPFSIFTSIGNIFFHQSAVANTATAASSGVASIVDQLFGGWRGTVSGDAGQVAQTMNEVRQSIEGDTLNVTLIGSGQWIVPEGYKDWVVTAISGGDGGQGGDGGTFAGGGGTGIAQGGVNGGQVGEIFTTEELGGAGASINYATGNAGAGGTGKMQFGGQGGQSVFGPFGPNNNYWRGQRDAGALPTGVGYAFAAKPGNGGNGGPISGTYTGTRGGAGPAAPGGNPGTRGQPGQNGTEGPFVKNPGGGGGGGGGGGNSGGFSAAGRGGDGGAAGAGGGAGGSSTTDSPFGAGGNGGAGRFYLQGRR